MTHLLHIDSSPRKERFPSEALRGSQSRQMTREFVTQWKDTHPNDTVTYRDLGHNPIPHLNEAWIAAGYTPPEQRTPELWQAIAESDRLVDELLAADIYVLGVPMYNFSIPSVLKAYIDQIVRIGRTFEFQPENTANPYKPLVLGKKMLIITARGSSGYGKRERYEHLNYQDPYLSTIFGLIGITDINFVHVENEELGGTSLTDAIAAARTQIAQLIKI